MFRLLIASVILTLGAACSEQAELVSRSPNGAHSLEAQKRTHLQQLERLLQDRDAVHAQLVWERLGRRALLRDGERDPAVAELKRRLDQELADQDVTATDAYIWARKPPTKDARWSEALAKARRHFQNYGKSESGTNTGVAVIRVHFEHPASEQRIGARPLELSYYSMKDDGYGGYDYPASGDFVLLGKPLASGPAHGDIQFESLRHEPVKLPIEIPEGEVGCAGEVLLRSAEPGNLGCLEVRVVPEDGLSLQNAVVRIGRQFAHWTGGYPLRPDGTCVLEGIAAGPCQAYVEVPDKGRSLRQQTTVEAGATTRIELAAYARRQVIVDWKYRIPAGQGDWQEGATTLMTGSPAPLNMWEQNGSVYTLGDWNGQAAEIRAVNGRLLPADPEDFEAGRITKPVELARTRSARERSSPYATDARPAAAKVKLSSASVTSNRPHESRMPVADQD